MNIDPTLIAAGTAIAAIAAAAGYAYLTGNDASASVDPDNDGEDEIDFEFESQDYPEGPAYADDNPEDELAAKPTQNAVTAAPEAVRDIGSDLTDITGIAETRASDLDAAGFQTASDLYFASDDELTDVNGIGEYTVGQIRDDIGSADENEDTEDAENDESGDESGSSE